MVRSIFKRRQACDIYEGNDILGVQYKGKSLLFDMEQREQDQLQLLGLNDPQRTSDSFEQSQAPIVMDDESPSTRIFRLAEEQIQCNDCFKLHSDILKHTLITQNMRARLRSFLMAQSSKQFMLRETCTLACTLVDLYFLNKGNVVVDEFQVLVIGCLILAAKLKEGKFPTISFNIFKREQLLAFEKRIARKLGYRLNPPTYHTYAERVVKLWDHFTAQQGVFNFKIVEDSKEGINEILRRFYQQLDCAFMVLKSLDFQIETLVLNLFYLNVRQVNVYEVAGANMLSDANFKQAFYPQPDKFIDFYEKFLHFYSKKDITLNIPLGLYLKSFLGVATLQKQWTIKGNSEALCSLRVWDKFQTVPKDNYKIAKEIIESTGKGGQKVAAKKK